MFGDTTKHALTLLTTSANATPHEPRSGYFISEPITIFLRFGVGPCIVRTFGVPEPSPGEEAAAATAADTQLASSAQAAGAEDGDGTVKQNEGEGGKKRDKKPTRRQEISEFSFDLLTDIVEGL